MTAYLLDTNHAAKAMAGEELWVIARPEKAPPVVDDDCPTQGELRARLAKTRLPAPTSDQQTLAELAGPSVRRQAHILSDLLSPEK